MAYAFVFYACFVAEYVIILSAVELLGLLALAQGSVKLIAGLALGTTGPA